MKRLISAFPSEVKNFTKDELKKSIQASEGRIIMAETVVTAAPLIEGVTNAEVMTAFGADLICLNELDVFHPHIKGFESKKPVIEAIKELTGRPIGINLEPVSADSQVLDEKVEISPGRRASSKAFAAAEKLGVDFVMVTANPSTGVTNADILAALATGRQPYSGLILAGKMHGAGKRETLIDASLFTQFIEAGADGVLMPSVGTVPGVLLEEAHQACQAAQAQDGLVMATIGTSQESASPETIRAFALNNKQVGADIHHIGDGSYGRMPDPENIMALSIAVRGKRHTYFKMAQSLRR